MIRLLWTEAASRREPAGGDALDFEFGTLLLDIAEADSYEISSLVTEHSVEGREQITDHQVPQIDRASVDVVVSERTASLALGVDGATVAAVELDGGGSATAITVPEGTTRTADALETLRRLCREGIPVDVEGLRRPVEGWVISSVSTSRDTTNTGALVCTMALQEVQVATAADVDAPSPRVERGRRNRDRGQQQGRATRDTAVPADPVYRDTATHSVQNDYGWDPETGELI